MSMHGAVLVTGASSGMGRACALRLSEGGFTVFTAIRKERDAQKARIAEALSRATRKRVEVKVVIDESVLGGIVATIGDTVIDGTVRHRLEQLKERM